MEILLNVRLEKLPEGIFLATSDDLPGLVAQGNTAEETLEIARGVARALIEVCLEDGEELPPTLKEVSQCAEVAIALGGVV